MGMFDSLYVGCPCGESVEFQSKAGECYLHRYTLADCPPAVAADLIGQSALCKCGRPVQLRGSVMLFADYYPANPQGKEP